MADEGGLIRHPLWSNVLGGLAVAALLAVGGYALDWWPAIRDALSAAGRWFLTETPTPNWALCLLAIPSAAAVLVVVAMVWDRLHTRAAPAGESEPHWSDYRTDTIAGVKWEWSYTSSGAITRLACFCPRCDFQIYPEQSGFVGAGVSFSCDNCHSRLGQYDDSKSTLQNFVERTILHRIKTGGWKSATGA